MLPGSPEPECYQYDIALTWTLNQVSAVAVSFLAQNYRTDALQIIVIVSGTAEIKDFIIIEPAPDRHSGTVSSGII